MQEDSKPCNFMISTVNDISIPVPKSLFLIIRNITPNVIGRMYRKIRLKFFSIRAKKYSAKARINASYPIQINNSDISFSSKSDPLNLRIGEWVEVRSFDEIYATLDKNCTLNGLGFMVGMEEFCGGKFRVFKRVKKIRLESVGEVKKLKNPVILLEGVFCDGKHYEECDRSCFFFWREAWLKRIYGSID